MVTVLTMSLNGLVLLKKISKYDVINKYVYNLNKMNTFLYLWKFGSLLCCCKKECKKEFYIAGSKGDRPFYIIGNP